MNKLLLLGALIAAAVAQAGTAENREMRMDCDCYRPGNIFDRCAMVFIDKERETPQLISGEINKFPVTELSVNSKEKTMTIKSKYTEEYATLGTQGRRGTLSGNLIYKGTYYRASLYGGFDEYEITCRETAIMDSED